MNVDSYITINKCESFKVNDDNCSYDVFSFDDLSYSFTTFYRYPL